MVARASAPIRAANQVRSGVVAALNGLDDMGRRPEPKHGDENEADED